MPAGKVSSTEQSTDSQELRYLTTFYCHNHPANSLALAQIIHVFILTSVY